MFQIFSPTPLETKAARWGARIAKQYPNVFGLSPFAHLFVCSFDERRIAVLCTERPELVELNFERIDEFKSAFLTNPEVLQSFFRAKDVSTLQERLGELGPGECYFPVPYPALGGSGSLETYDRGDAWVHLDLYGQTIGL